MFKSKNKGFTLVELLVVITILAIISVVAYQNFWWAVDKAVSGRKISDVSTIETSLQQYRVDKNYYPFVDPYNPSTDRWWYNSLIDANRSNTLETAKTWAEIDSIISANWGWRVMWINWTDDWTGKQIWAKWTISQSTLGKKYLTKDLYDPELGDIKVWWSWKMIEQGIGRYVYAVFKKPFAADTNWTSNQQWTYYNIAYTIKVDWGDKYITKIVWDYDSESCFDEKDSCPETLIWSSSDVLLNKDTQISSDTTTENQWIPYPVNWY